MSSNEPKITVITCCYNYGKYFDEYYEGLKKQIKKPDLVVIVDDASTDGSYDYIASKFDNVQAGVLSINPAFIPCKASKDGMKFLLIRMKDNGGPSVARNIAIKATLEDTDIYAIYDMDDIYYPDKISLSLEAFRRYPHVGVVYSDYDTKDMRTGHKEREIKEPFDYMRLCQECIVSNNSLIAASLIKRVGIYDENLRVAEDYDLWLRYAEAAVLYHIPEALYEYRVTGEGASFSVNKDVWQKCWQRVHDKRVARHKK